MPKAPTGQVRPRQNAPGHGEWPGATRNDKGETDGSAAQGTHHRRHPGQVVRAQIGAGGEAETVPEEGLGHAAAHACAVVEDRLSMHGLPHRAGFDVLSLQGQADGFPIHAELGRVHGDDGEPAGVASPGVEKGGEACNTGHSTS